MDRLRGDAGVDASVLPGFFRRDRPIFVARAPGRLDVMGGIADYSGSLVLELPIAEATLAAAQVAQESGLWIVSLPVDPEVPVRELQMTDRQLADLRDGSYDDARSFFGAGPDRRWAAYVVGPMLALQREAGVAVPRGLRLLVRSQVPEGKGVSSSAALEVATLMAVLGLTGVTLQGTEIAGLCQLAENRVVGAPCGIMDPMTSVLGRENELLELLCQPADVLGFRPLPESRRVWGIDSGIRHAVSGSDYTSVRTAAFMGHRILAELAGLEVTPAADGRVEIPDDPLRGCLANLDPVEFEATMAESLPERMIGAEFLRRYQGTIDAVTRVDPGRTYAVRAATRHPVHEHARVRRFAELLGGDVDDDARAELGARMLASHQSYTDCGLGSDGTDLLVELVREVGLASDLSGARITGGGSGGTVAVLGNVGAGAAVTEVARRYAERTGRDPWIVQGSSSGAQSVGVLRLDPVPAGDG